MELRGAGRRNASDRNSAIEQVLAKLVEIDTLPSDEKPDRMGCDSNGFFTDQPMGGYLIRAEGAAHCEPPLLW